MNGCALILNKRYGKNNNILYKKIESSRNFK